MKSKLMPAIGILISIAGLLLLRNTIDISRVINYIVTAEYWWIVPAVMVSLTSFVFRSLRFRSMLAPIKSFSFIRAYQYIAINYMANNVFPARAGEVILSYAVRSREEIPLGTTLSVTLFGRIFDGLLLLGALSASLLYISVPKEIQTVLVFGLIIFGAAMAFMVWLIVGKEDHWSALRRWSYGFVPSWLEKVFNIGADQLKQFRRGILPLRSPRLAAIVLITSGLNWIVEGMVYYLVGMAFGLELSIFSWVLVLAITNLATAVPSAPAGIGTFHAAVAFSLMAVGVSSDSATAYGFVLHATQVVPITLLGAAAYFRLSLKSVLKEAI